MTSDLLHHIKNELTAPQILHIIRLHSKLMHDPAYGAGNLHMAFAKVLFNMADVIITKVENPAQVLTAMLETGVSRLEALVITHEEVRSSLERSKAAQKAHDENVMQDVEAEGGGSKQDAVPPVVDILFIEKSRPVGGAPYATEKPEEVLQGEVCNSYCIFRCSYCV